MKARRLLMTAGVVAALAGTQGLLEQAGASTRRATLSTFAGHWYGHTRSLTIDGRGRAHESIDDGCCDHVIDLGIIIYSVRGNVHDATATARVSWVHVHDRSAYAPGYAPPRIGETGLLRLKAGVITEPFEHITYCDLAADEHGKCGA